VLQLTACTADWPYTAYSVARGVRRGGGGGPGSLSLSAHAPTYSGGEAVLTHTTVGGIYEGVFLNEP